jgi:hypothetical protein
VHGAAALPALSTSSILPLTMAWLARRDLPKFRGVALCVVDDVLEHCSPAGLAILPEVLPHIMEVLSLRCATVTALRYCHCAVLLSPRCVTVTALRYCHCAVLWSASL